MVTNKRDLFNTERDLNLYNYMFYINLYKNDIYFHIGTIFASMILYSMLIPSLPQLLNWISSISLIIGTVLVSLISIYIYKLIDSWDKTVHSGLIEFWNLCLKLAVKNYIIYREYNEIYHYHYKDILRDCYEHIDISNGNTKTYSNYVIENDLEHRMEKQEWITESFTKIVNYIKLSYYLSFLNRDDVLEMKSDKIFVNISSESILNKRNRKLEQLINWFSESDKSEIVKAWDTIDKESSERFMVTVPFKFIVYEYRKIFKYLYSAKYFKDVFSILEKDCTEIENLAFEICGSVHTVFRRKTVYFPKIFTKMLGGVIDLFILILDSYIAVNLLSYIVNSGSLLIPLVLSGTVHVLIICALKAINNMINEIKDPLENFADVDNIDNRIENIFNEINAVMMYNRQNVGKI